MNVQELKAKTPQFFHDDLKIMAGTPAEEQARQNYLQGICQRLIGDEIDFERYPVYFCIVDDDRPNAAFVPGKKPKIIDEKDFEQFGDYRTEEEKIEDAREQVPTIFVTKGLLKLVENEDQLAFILGHELGHHRQDFLSDDDHSNSKMEELTSDLNSLDMMAKAGYNINEARKLASHIFSNESSYQNITQILARSLDAHPNNESRLNAIDIKIKTIEDDYQKQNININNIEPTEISPSIKNDIQKNRYLSTVEQELIQLGYYNDENSLERKQEILLQYMRDILSREEMLKSHWSRLLSYQHRDALDNIVFAHIAMHRENMPRRIIKQSDANLFSEYLMYNQIQEYSSKWFDIIGKYYTDDTYSSDMPHNAEKRIGILQSFPFKIVPDDEYEAQVAIEARKEQEFQRQIDNQTNLAVNFWDDIIQIGCSDYSRYVGTAIATLKDFDISKSKTGQNAISELEDAFANKGLTFNNIGALYQDYAFTDETKMPKHLAGYRHDAAGMFYYYFDKQSIPSLNLETNENPTNKFISPQVLYSRNFPKELFGIESVQPIIGNISLVFYNPDYSNITRRYSQSTWGYFVDDKGNIIDSFPIEKRKEKEQELVEKINQDMHKELAYTIKQHYSLLQKLKETPYTSELSESELRLLKQYTGAISISSENMLSNLEAYNESIKIDGDTTIYTTNSVKNIFSSQYREMIKQNGIGYGLVEFDEELLYPYLTQEEQDFISYIYNKENDESVFEAMYTDMENHIEDEFFSGLNSLHCDSYTFNEYVHNYYLLSDNTIKGFTNNQVIRYHDKYFNLVDEATLKHNQTMIANGYFIEAKNLYAYLTQQINNNPDLSYSEIDFSDYKPLFADQMFSKCGINLQDMSNYQQPDRDITSAHGALINLALTMHILKGENNRLPLKELYNKKDRRDPLFTNVAKEKFEPFLFNRENYPADTLEAVETFYHIPSKLYDIEKVGPFIIDMIKKEPNPKKALGASIHFLNTIKSIDSDLANRFKNDLLEGSVIFDKSIPLLNRISAYQQICNVSGFADDYKIQNSILKSFIPEIEAIQDPNERNAVYDIFINKQHRISDPDIRREYQRLWVDSAFAACGNQIDDNSELLHSKVKFYTDKLHGSYKAHNWVMGDYKEDNVNMADRVEIAKLMADKFVSQQKLSMMIKPEPASFDEMDKGNRKRNHFMISGFDSIKYLIEYKPEESSEFIDFLLSKGEMKECIDYSQHIQDTTKNDIINCVPKISPETLQVIHREFWGYPLEARAVLINELLHSSNDSNDEEKWENIFKKVAPRIFPNADSDMSRIGTEFLHSYIKSRKENERTLYLAAMMVAANENSSTTDPEKSIAKGIRLFLENSGPAAIKLGQAMASYTDVPKFIRDEMQELKSNASRPSRWEIYEWLDFYKNKDNDSGLQYGEDVWLGKIIGSASYFVTLEKGKFKDGKLPENSDKVTKILRAGAKIASDKEFKIFENMLYDLAQKGVMKNGIDSFLRLVKQAQETVEIETNLDIGYSQLETAKKLYKEKQITADGHTFKLRVIDWPEFGKNWADLERANGVDLDEIQDPQYKKAVSKAYFTVELMNMLSGSRFDHDRHGKQLKIDTETNTIGLFDTGAMAIVDPSEKDKQLLGQVIYRTLQKALDYSSDESNAFGKIGAILSSEIEKVYEDKLTDSTYLTECQRGLLALTDFYKDLSAQDFLDCVNGAINNKEMPIDKSIIRGFVQESIKNIGVFQSEQPLLSHKDKETLGALIFNVYANASIDGTQNIGTTIAKEVQKLREQNIEMPILNIISNKLSDKSQSIGLNIPKEFVPTISQVVQQKNIDVAILKGIMKEAVKSIDLQEQKDNYPEQDRKELGKLIYDTFDLMLTKSINKEKINMADAFLQLQSSGQYNTELGLKIAAVIKTAKQIDGESANININEIVKASLLSGKMDTHIAKGISEQFKHKNPNLILRTQIAKGLNAFLSQSTQDMGYIKKTIIKMIVRKPNAIKDTQEEIDKQISKPETNKKFVGMIKGYIDKFARLINQKKIEPKISIKER